MNRLGTFLALGLVFTAPVLAQNGPVLPRWTYEDEVAFYKPLKGECQIFHRETVGFVGANMAMRTCYDEYAALWPDIEQTTALSDRWILLQSIGDSGNSGGARMRLVYHEREKPNWAFIDRGEIGKEPATAKPRGARAATIDRILSTISTENQIDDPGVLPLHSVTTYITIFDGESISRKAFIHAALDNTIADAELAKLKALEVAVWKLGAY